MVPAAKGVPVGRRAGLLTKRHPGCFEAKENRKAKNARLFGILAGPVEASSVLLGCGSERAGHLGGGCKLVDMQWAQKVALERQLITHVEIIFERARSPAACPRALWRPAYTHLDHRFTAQRQRQLTQSSHTTSARTAFSRRKRFRGSQVKAWRYAGHYAESCLRAGSSREERQTARRGRASEAVMEDAVQKGRWRQRSVGRLWPYSEKGFSSRDQPLGAVCGWTEAGILAAQASQDMNAHRTHPPTVFLFSVPVHRAGISVLRPGAKRRRNPSLCTASKPSFSSSPIRVPTEGVGSRHAELAVARGLIARFSTVLSSWD